MTKWNIIYEGERVRLDFDEKDRIAKLVLHSKPLNEIGLEVLNELEEAFYFISPDFQGSSFETFFGKERIKERIHQAQAGVHIARHILKERQLKQEQQEKLEFVLGKESFGKVRSWFSRKNRPKSLIEPSVLVLASENPKGFSAGADLRKLFKEAIQFDTITRRAVVAVFLDRIHRLYNHIDTLPFPTIAAINGICFGGGFELALTCDLKIAERSARFAFPELRLGLIPGFGGIPRLKRDISNSFIRDIVLTGRSINAKRAFASNLVQQVVPRGEGVSAAIKMAQQIKKYDSHTAKLAKRFIKPIPYRELEEEKKIFLHLIERPIVMEALHKFVHSTDTMPYLA